ncbi:MAG: DUF1289 domain-containing protein [Calditrichaeota bacterium]|nr:MAG: DUF1289 domain-containing protein [Calditrichota bacterium]
MNKNSPVQSPCIKICELDSQTNICKGCLRTMNEISNWGFLTELEKLKIVEELPNRRFY